MTRLTGYLRLMRPANVITAVSDVLAGVAIVGSMASLDSSEVPFGTTYGEMLMSHFSLIPVAQILWLMLSTACLYGGGVVLNDVFDASLDKIERPERPIPSGLIKRSSAALFGSALLTVGIAAAFLSWHGAAHDPAASPLLALAIAVACVVYDKWSKHHSFFGPVNMGLCRGLNLALGLSLSYYALDAFWPLCFIPLIYIAAITMISRGEVHGGRKVTFYVAAFLYLLVIAVLIFFAFLNQRLSTSLILLAIFALLIFPPLIRALRKPEGPRIGKAVKSGVIGLIAMNASWAAAFGDIFLACLILLLLPLSLWLARLFAVT